MVGLCNIPTFDQYMLKLPNFSLSAKNVPTYLKQMCQVQVLRSILDQVATSLDFTLILIFFVVVMILQEPIKPFSFVAFGAGPRLCLGMNLAKLEISLFVHFLVTKYRQHFTFSIIIAQTTKYLHHVPSLKNSMQISLLKISHDSILSASMGFNVHNQSLILMVTSLKIELRRCNLTSLFFIKGTGTRIVFQD